MAGDTTKGEQDASELIDQQIAEAMTGAVNVSRA